MNAQKKVIVETPLLDELGNLTQPGWSTRLIWNYSRDDIKANQLRIKEWDYYLVYNKDIALAFTIADNSYMGMISASVINLKAKKEQTKSVLTFMPKGKFNLPETSEIGNTCFKNKKVEMKFLNDGKIRKIIFNYPNFEGKNTLSGELTLTNCPKDSMAIATPFDKDKHFYYNQKIIGFRVDGSFRLGNKLVELLPKDTFGILDWGRGVWTYKNTWYWGAGAGRVNNADFGFNIGYGFGNTSAATENVIFYKGIAHKFGSIKFEIPTYQNGQNDFMSPWRITSNDHRFEMKFQPIINRHSNSNIGIIGSNQNQVFGTFSGKAVLDDGTVITIKDFMGFAEKVVNKW